MSLRKDNVSREYFDINGGDGGDRAAKPRTEGGISGIL
jgi:hypothetical protein